MQVAPKRAALKAAQDELAATMASLAEAQAKLKVSYSLTLGFIWSGLVGVVLGWYWLYLHCVQP